MIDAERVIEAMADERQRLERQLTGLYDTPEAEEEARQRLNAASDERIFAAAARHLSPSQARAFRQMLDDNMERNRLWEELRRMRSRPRAARP